MYYTLDDDHNVIPTDDATAAFKRDRTVRKTDVGDQHVSTVFLPIDHGWGNEKESPVVFETLIFGGPHGGEMWRYCTWDEAIEGHERAVAMLKREEVYVP